MATGIYKIQSLIKPERIYIGSALDIKKRWMAHKGAILRNNHHSIKLQRHANKHSIDDLMFSIIELCRPEFLIIREQYYINDLSPFFNIAISSDNPMFGRYHSIESKLKIGEANSNKSSWSKGLHLTEEHKKKIGDGNKGKKISDKSKEKMRIAAIGRKLSEGCRNKISNALTGRFLSEEHKRKLSIARRKRKNYNLSESHRSHIKERMIEVWEIKRRLKIA